MSVFIPSQSLPHLKEYKYASEDRSLTTKYVLKPFWLKFAKVFPLTMAPNMVTLLGLLFIIIADLLILYYDPNLEGKSPAWLCVYHGFAVFMYQTFDACDGLHARRTKQSSPLGELFDHVCDSMNTTFMCIQFASVASFGRTWLVFITQFATLTNFYLSTWEEFYTKKLFLSEISGPVEGLLLMAIMFSLTGVFGVDAIWKFKLFELNLFNGESFLIDSTHVSILTGSLIMIFNIYSARRNVLNSFKDITLLKANPMAGLVPFFTYYLIVFVLLLTNPIIMSDFTLSMILTIGSTVSFMVGRIITGHLTMQDFPYVNLPMFLPILQLASIFTLQRICSYTYVEIISMVVYVGLGLSVAIYGMFLTDILYSITNYLDIYALSIKHPKVIKDE